MHAKLLKELRQTGSETDREYNSTKNLKEEQLVLMKNHNAKAFQPKYLVDHQIIKIVNGNTGIVARHDGREQECNIHHIKPITPIEAFTSTFEELTKYIKREHTNLSTQSSVQKQPHYHLQSYSKHQH